MCFAHCAGHGLTHEIAASQIHVYHPLPVFQRLIESFIRAFGDACTVDQHVDSLVLLEYTCDERVDRLLLRDITDDLLMARTNEKFTGRRERIC